MAVHNVSITEAPVGPEHIQSGTSNLLSSITETRNIITNSALITPDTYWTKDVGWATTANQAVASASPNSNGIYQSLGISGRWYEITYTITTCTAGGFRAKCGSGGLGTIRSTTGTYIEFLQCSGSAGLGVIAWNSASGSTSGVIDDIIIKLADFSLPTVGWHIGITEYPTAQDFVKASEAFTGVKFLDIYGKPLNLKYSINNQWVRAW